MVFPYLLVFWIILLFQKCSNFNMEFFFNSMCSSWQGLVRSIKNSCRISIFHQQCYLDLTYLGLGYSDTEMEICMHSKGARHVLIFSSWTSTLRWVIGKCSLDINSQIVFICVLSDLVSLILIYHLIIILVHNLFSLILTSFF